jgi:hypothetical protein
MAGWRVLGGLRVPCGRPGPAREGFGGLAGVSRCVPSRRNPRRTRAGVSWWGWRGRSWAECSPRHSDPHSCGCNRRSDRPDFRQHGEALVREVTADGLVAAARSIAAAHDAGNHPGPDGRDEGGHEDTETQEALAPTRTRTSSSTCTVSSRPGQHPARPGKSAYQRLSSRVAVKARFGPRHQSALVTAHALTRVVSRPVVFYRDFYRAEVG